MCQRLYKVKNMAALKDKLKYKLKAISIHLLLSLLIFVVILYFILFDWYPEPFFTAQGGWQGIQLMAFVDLVLGPVLTFIVYDQLKQRKLIILDLSVIDRKSTRLNSSHQIISYAVFCLKKKKKTKKKKKKNLNEKILKIE